MKDPTRGGFASAINEMARKSGVCVRIREETIPCSEEREKCSRDAGD